MFCNVILFKSLIYNDSWGLAGEPGFEPGLTESESVGLPLTYSPTSGGGFGLPSNDVLLGTGAGWVKASALRYFSSIIRPIHG